MWYIRSLILQEPLLPDVDVCKQECIRTGDLVYRQEQLDVSLRERKIHRDPAGTLPWVQWLSGKSVRLVIGRSRVQFPARSLWIFLSLSKACKLQCSLVTTSLGGYQFHFHVVKFNQWKLAYMPLLPFECNGVFISSYIQVRHKDQHVSYLVCSLIIQHIVTLILGYI